MLLMLNFPAEPPTWQYAVGGLIVCGLYLLVTRGRALRPGTSQPVTEEAFQTPLLEESEPNRQAA